MVILKHKDTGLMKECPTGYSWTTCFFGLFVPLIRGDLKWSAIFFALTILVGSITAGFGIFLMGPIFAFFYNKIYISGLLLNGFIPADDSSHNWCVVNGLLTGQLIKTQKTQTVSPSKNQHIKADSDVKVKIPLLEQPKKKP